MQSRQTLYYTGMNVLAHLISQGRLCSEETYTSCCDGLKLLSLWGRGEGEGKGRGGIRRREVREEVGRGGNKNQANCHLSVHLGLQTV